MAAVFSGFFVCLLITVVLCLPRGYLKKQKNIATFGGMRDGSYDSASVVPIHTRSELSSYSDSAYNSASVASVASVDQPQEISFKLSSIAR